MKFKNAGEAGPSYSTLTVVDATAYYDGGGRSIGQESGIAFTLQPEGNSAILNTKQVEALVEALQKWLDMNRPEGASPRVRMVEGTL